MGSKCRSVSAIIILAAILIATGVCVFASTWSTYHYDHRRIGVTTQENLDAGNLKLIWTFPRYDNFGTGMISDAVVDVPSSPNNGWELTGNWSGRGSLPNPPSDYYGNDFRYAVTVNYPHEPTATAIWRLPAGSPVGSYSIQVYFPSSGGDTTNASNARYTVHHANGAITYKIDQRDGGGWITLGTGTFTLDADSYVELTNVIDRDPNDRTEYIVCADAVRFIPQLDMEIYSSPTAADLTDPTNPTSSIPFVWIGTVEGPMASGAPDTDDSDEFGAVYCVYSYNDNDITTTDPENDDSFWNNYKVQSVGTAKWRYPAGGRFDASGKTPNNRSPLEGPIGRLGNGMGGVFSAPTYIPERNLVVFGGMDGQVYCVRATNGELVWKGPGVTIPEEGNASGLWNERDNRFDAFGGSFLYAPCTTDTGGAAKIEYNILGTSSDPGTDANRGENGHMYAIYAWMPARDPATEVDGNGNPILRSRDATYTITFDGTQTRTIRIDQRDSTDPNIGSGMSSNPNAGKWVRLGSSYWNPRKVTLTTETQIASQINEELGNGDTITRVVVADAIMVVPEDIGPFSYSTPVYDGVNSVYIGNTNGRVYSLNIANGRLNWTYPKVQTKRSISMSNPQDAAASPFGSIVSSPALNFYGSSTGIGSRKLVVSSMDGKVYCLSNLSAGENGVELEWQYSAASRWGTGAQNEQELFSASPVIDGNEVYVPSTGGRMHAIDLQDGNCLWVSPDSADNSVPLSPFRYSTPAVYDNRVVCGSTGGMVYRFDPNNGQIDETLDVRLYSPIQGAIAVDGNHMYISTMDGSIWWVDRNTGNAPANGRAGYTNLGQLFSSPAVANTYVYVGSGNGRLYAFSDEAFGGMWVGGGKEGYRDVPATEQDAASVNP
ncbi:MAG TPA: PQQ-binding-like beta-propeller repeat protein, partial [Armatimonadota bacterium]|nr:PQQ-binding-like beta-propeller repeat protein [Armatimonadota bacterium]